MASGQGGKDAPAGSSDTAKMMRVLIPAAAIGGIVILAAVVAGLSDGGSRKMSDGSDGSVYDPGLKDLTPGVRYRDLKEGAGEECSRGATVRVHYTGWLGDGTVFDSSKDHGPNPTEFSLNGVIAGWRDGIPGMKPGGVRKLVIAPDQGYGKMSKPGIPGGSTLIFEVELVSIATPPTTSRLTDGTEPGADDPNLKEISPGVKYRDLKEGVGPPCSEDAEIKIHYTGWLLNGKTFDSSRTGGIPATFKLSGLIPGWKEGIPGMKPGGIRKLVISPEKGYGAQNLKEIPPNSTLVFEVELFEAN